MDDQPKSDPMTSREVAEYLECSLDTVRRLAERGDLPFERFPGPRSHRRFSRRAVQDFRARLQHPTRVG